jgi:predicted transposase YdaD
VNHAGFQQISRCPIHSGVGNPHDALFRRTFGRPEHAAPLLRALLPSVLVAAIDWSTLTPVPTSGVDDRLRSGHCDVAFTVVLAGRRVLLYVLFEHKSRPDRWTVLQVLAYMVRTWQDLLRATPRPRRLPPILPVVVHCGRRPWRASTSLRSLLDLGRLPAGLRKAIVAMQPQFACVPHDFAGRSEAEVRAMALSLHGLWSLACMQFIATQRDDDDAVAKAIADWADVARQALVSPTGQDALDAVTSYLLQTTKLERRRLQVVLEHHLGPAAMKKFVSTYEQIRREGIVEGRNEGKVEGRVEGKVEGMAEGMATALLRVLAHRFGDVPEACAARIRRAPLADLERWMDRVLDAPSLDALFDA